MSANLLKKFSLFDNKEKSNKTKTNDEPLFSIKDSFGSASSEEDNESFEDSNTITPPKSNNSTLFGDYKSLISSSGSNSDDSTIAIKNEVLQSDNSLKNKVSALSSAKENNNDIETDNLAKSTNLKLKMASRISYMKYVKIFGITLLISLLLGSILTTSGAKKTVDDMKNKFFGFINLPDILPNKDVNVAAPKPRKPVRGANKRDVKEQEREKREEQKEEDLNKPVENRHKYKPHVMPDDATSLLQATKPSGKAGWCYIGEDRGFRSCVEVNRNDTCTSGIIFENNEKCIHPELRFT